MNCFAFIIKVIKEVPYKKLNIADVDKIKTGNSLFISSSSER